VRGGVLIDTGPLVAFLNRRDRFHDWAVAQLDEIEPPLLTCEAVLSESCFLLRHDPAGPTAVLDLVHNDLLRVGLNLQAEIVALRRLARRYSRIPMSLADACLVRLAELNADSVLLTLDSDFRIYRMHGRQVVPTLMPAAI
jgi:predicted nucleic acid-binding protein